MLWYHPTDYRHMPNTKWLHIKNKKQLILLSGFILAYSQRHYSLKAQHLIVYLKHYRLLLNVMSVISPEKSCIILSSVPLSSQNNSTPEVCRSIKGRKKTWILLKYPPDNQEHRDYWELTRNQSTCRSWRGINEIKPQNIINNHPFTYRMARCVYTDLRVATSILGENRELSLSGFI